jgi:hypothetical protein
MTLTLMPMSEPAARSGRAAGWKPYCLSFWSPLLFRSKRLVDSC